MIGAVVGALVIGLLAIFSVSVGQGVYAGQDTSGWPATLTSITGNITPVIGIVGIIAIPLCKVRASRRVGISAIMNRPNSGKAKTYIGHANPELSGAFGLLNA